jgi:hypothetical protein
MSDEQHQSVSAVALHFEEEIARLANHYYEEEGRPEGRAAEHWHRAEEEIRNQSSVGPDPAAFGPLIP